MTTGNPIEYNNMVRWRKECHEKFGSILDMRVERSPWAFVTCGWGDSVLDVGAGVEKKLQMSMSIPSERYFSLDNDPSGSFNFRTFEEVPKNHEFGLVVMSQFIEHLDLETGIGFLREAFRVLEPGGHLFISVPNASHPVRYHADVTHITNWSHNDLYGLLREVGYEIVDMGRSNKISPSRNLIKRWIVQTVCKEIRIDWCDTICVLARKPKGLKNAC